MHMPDNASTQVPETQENKPSSEVKYIVHGNTTYEVVTNYGGKSSLLDIVKSAIKRDIESGNY
jgi:hypothetical protein